MLTYAQAAAQAPARNLAGNYVRMILDPIKKVHAVRYADDNLTPTGLVHLLSTFSINPPTAGANNTPVIQVRWKVNRTGQANNYWPIFYTPDITTTGNTITTYGAPQDQWQAVNSLDRTLAFGINVQGTGLGPGYFWPTGRYYFLCLQDSELLTTRAQLIAAGGEEVASQLVLAGKGFSVSANDLFKREGGVTLPFLPQGPMSFVFSDPGSAGALGTTQGDDETVASNPWLMVIGYAIPQGQTLLARAAHHIEYVPTYSAAGLIQSASQPPSSSARDLISSSLTKVAGELWGSTDLSTIQGVLRSAGGLASAAGSAGVPFASMAGSALSGASQMMALVGGGSRPSFM